MNVVDQGSKQKLLKCLINMKVPALEPNDIKTIIGAQNKSINTTKCRFRDQDKVTNGMQMWYIGISEESIEAMRQLEFKPFLSLRW